jgi:hypothetical protein
VVGPALGGTIIANFGTSAAFWTDSATLTEPMAAVLGPRTVLVGAGVGGAAAVLLTLAVPGVTRPKYLSEEPQ